MSEGAGAAYAQLLSLGLVWISVHCAGMCGPLVIGLDVAGAGRGLPAWRGALRIGLYQLGRMTTLMTLGALAGLVGRGLARVFEPAAAVIALGFGLVVLGAVARRVMRERRPQRPPRTRLEQRGAGERPRNTRLEQRGAGERPRRVSLGALARPLSLSSTPGGTWLLGALMGFLPCMIVVWALGLAATTASVVHGALVMGLLVVMTTPMLLGVTLLPRLWQRRASALPQALMALSALWLIAAGLAGLELLPHVHVPAGDYVIMLW